MISLTTTIFEKREFGMIQTKLNRMSKHLGKEDQTKYIRDQLKTKADKNYGTGIPKKIIRSRGFYRGAKTLASR